MVQLVLAAVALAPAAVVAQQEVMPQPALGPALGAALIRLQSGSPLLHHLQPALVGVAATIRMQPGALLLQHHRPALTVALALAVATVAVLAAMMVEVPDLPCLMRTVHNSCKALLDDVTGVDTISPSK